MERRLRLPSTAKLQCGNLHRSEQTDMVAWLLQVDAVVPVS